MKRSPLKRGTSRLKRTPLRKVSRKRRGEAKQRAAVRAEAIERAEGRCVLAPFIPEVPQCLWWLPGEVDEKVNRSQHPGAHLVVEFTQHACHAHHAWKTTHPLLAHERGIRWKGHEVDDPDTKVVPRPELRETA